MTDVDRAQAVGSERRLRGRHARRVAMHLVYGLLSLWALLQAQGVVQLAAGTVPDRLHFGLACSTVFKLLTLGGALVLAFSGGRSVAATQWVLAGQLAWLVAGVAAPEGGRLAALATGAVGVAIWLGPWLLLSWERRRLFRLDGRPERLLTVLIGLAAAGAVAWLAGAARSGPFRAPGLEQEARFDLVGLGVAVVLVGVWAALVVPARRWPAAVVGSAVALTGLLAVVWPAGVASPGRAAGMVGAVVGLGVVARNVRRSGRSVGAEREVVRA